MQKNSNRVYTKLFKNLKLLTIYQTAPVILNYFICYVFVDTKAFWKLN